MQSTLKGITKLDINHDSLAQELDQNWEVLAGPIQTVMRRYGIEQPYEKLKTLTRGKKISGQEIQAFIDTLDLPAISKTNSSPQATIWVMPCGKSHSSIRQTDEINS